MRANIDFISNLESRISDQHMSKRIPRKLSILVFTLLAFAATAIAQAPAPVFKAGAARREVTPREPVPMWGYGDRHDALSVGTLDQLYAEALVIQAGDRKLAIIGLDLGRSPAEASLQRIRQRIKSEAGVEYSFIAGSHTHHGPVLELTDEAGKGKGRFDAALRYYREMEDAIVAAVVEANSILAPAKMATGSIQLEGFNRNRHTKQPVKPSDRELAVMRFDDANGKPIAILVNFTAHPTMIPATTLRFSADYVGAMKAEVEKATGARVIFMQGAAGDQSVNAPNRDYAVPSNGAPKAPPIYAQPSDNRPSTSSLQQVILPKLKVHYYLFQFGFSFHLGRIAFGKFGSAFTSSICLLWRMLCSGM
jgi:hypothetical protein